MTLEPRQEFLPWRTHFFSSWCSSSPLLPFLLPPPRESSQSSRLSSTSATPFLTLATTTISPLWPWQTISLTGGTSQGTGRQGGSPMAASSQTSSTRGCSSRNSRRPTWDPNLSDQDMMTGVNFASAGSGFDERTSHLSHTLPLSTQVDLFEEYLRRLGDIAGDKEASRIVTNSLIFINSGTNDFTRYYRSSRRRMDIGEYQDTILGMVHEYVKELYNLGGRKFCLAGLPPFGCLPIQITLSGNPDRACVEEQNRDAQDYNTKLEKMLPTLQRSLNGSKIVYLNAYQAFGEILDNTNRYGFTEKKRGCCGTGLTEVGLLCNVFTRTCRDPSSYVFYDAVHPTERVYRIATDYMLKNVIPQF